MTKGRRGSTVLTAFTEHMRADPDAAAVYYFGNRISRADLDALSDGFADYLAAANVGRGDRLTVSLQNTPLFAVALLATLKLGAILVTVHPTLEVRELATLLADCEPRVVLAHPDRAGVVTAASQHLPHRPELCWSSPSDLAGDFGARWLAGPYAVPSDGAFALPEIIRRKGRSRPFHDPAAEDVALLTYTSGTTGPPRAAKITHANMACQAGSTPNWLGLAAGDIVLTTEPFSHATGLGLHLALALGNGLPLVMTYRFEPRLTLELIQQYAPAFTAGTITSFVALAEEAGRDEWARTALSRMSTVVTGGSPLPAAVVDRYESQFGVYIRNAYGLTESASVCIAVPPGERAPIDPGSGAVSIGRPVPGVTVSIVMDNGGAAPPGVGGEIVVHGPQVATGYWNRPDHTASTFKPDGLHTGDVGFVDDQGWIYLVDRKQDLIVVNGYKVWPRDVEDVLCQHPFVAEAAVIGIPDDVRGQTVIAFVVPRSDVHVVVDDLHRLCREHLSAYKCPRRYEVVSTLPKSASGTVLRRSLRVGA